MVYVECTKASIAGAVHEACTEHADRIPPERRCLIYSISGAMLASEATGKRHVVVGGGYSFEDRPGVTAVLGAAWPGRPQRSHLDLHCWISQVPDDTNPEDVWQEPGWTTVTDLWLRLLAPIREAAGAPLHRAIPPFVWGPIERVKDQTGITYRPDRESMRHFLELVTSSETWSSHLDTADQVARTAARNLGLRISITADSAIPATYRCPLAKPGCKH